MGNPTTLPLLLLTLTIFLLISLRPSVNAINFTFNGGTSGSDLARPESYGINAIPSSVDHLTIPANSIASISTSFSIKSIILQSNSTLVIRNNASLQFQSGITVSSGATMIVQEGATVITTMATWLDPLSSTTSTQPTVSFPTITIMGQLVMYPNSLIAGTVQSNSDNIAPPLVLLIQGVCRVVSLQTTATTTSVINALDSSALVGSPLLNKPTMFQNIRIVTFSGGIFMYGQGNDQIMSSNDINTIASNPSAIIQPIIFDFVLFNVNKDGSLIVHADAIGSQILNIDQYLALVGDNVPDGSIAAIGVANSSGRPNQPNSSSSSTTLSNSSTTSTIQLTSRPNKIIVESDAQFSIKFGPDTIIPSSTASSTTSGAELGLFVDVRLLTGSKFTIQASNTSSSSSTTTLPSGTSRKAVSILGTFNADAQSTLYLGPYMTLSISAQQCQFSTNSQLIISAYSTLRHLGGVTLFSGLIDAHPQSHMEIFSPFHFATPSLTLSNVKIYSGTLCLGTDLLTTPLKDVTLTINGELSWYGGTHIVSLGTGVNSLRPRHTLILSPTSTLFVTSSTPPLNVQSLIHSTSTSPNQHILRHTVMKNQGLINLSSPFIIQDNGQLINSGSSSVIINPSTGLIQSDKNLGQSPMLVNGNNNNNGGNQFSITTVNNQRVTLSQDNTDIIFIDTSTALFTSQDSSRGDVTVIDASIVFNNINIVTTQQLFNSTAIFTRPILIKSILPYISQSSSSSSTSSSSSSSASSLINPNTSFNFVFDNNQQHFSTDILLTILPTTLNHPYLGLNFIHFHNQDLNNPLSTSVINSSPIAIPSTIQLKWFIHSLRLINSSILLQSQSSFQLASICQLGSVNGVYSGGLFAPSTLMEVGYMYLFRLAPAATKTNPISFKTITVAYGLYLFSLSQQTLSSSSSSSSTTTSIGNTAAYLNFNSMVLLDSSFSSIERSLTFTNPQSLLTVYGSMIIKPGILADIGLDQNNQSDGGVIIKSTGRVHFDSNTAATGGGTTSSSSSSSSSSSTSTGTRTMTTSAVNDISTSSASSSSSSSTSSFNTNNVNRSPLSQFNIKLLNNGILDLDNNSNVIISRPFQSQLDNSSPSSNTHSDTIINAIVLGDGSLLTINPSPNSLSTNSNSTNYIARISGTNASLLINTPTVIDEINVRYVQVQDQSKSSSVSNTNSNNNNNISTPSTVFSQGCFAFQQQSLSISQPKSPVSFIIQNAETTPITTGSTNNDNIGLSTANPNRLNPIITRNTNPTTTIGQPTVHVCPPTSTSKFDVLLWVFLALFLVFLVLSIILAIFPVVCMRKNYEKRLKEVNALNRRNVALLASSSGAAAGSSPSTDGTPDEMNEGKTGDIMAKRDDGSLDLDGDDLDDNANIDDTAIVDQEGNPTTTTTTTTSTTGFAKPRSSQSQSDRSSYATSTKPEQERNSQPKSILKRSSTRKHSNGDNDLNNTKNDSARSPRG